MRTPPVFRPLGLALMAVAATGVLLQIGPASASSEAAKRSPSATKRQALAAYGKLPLAFSRSRSARRRVRYAAQAGGAVFFTDEAVFALSEGQAGARASARLPRRNPAARVAGARPGRAGSTTCSATTRPAGSRTSPPTASRLPRPLAGGRPAPSRPRAESSSTSSASAGRGSLPDPARATAASSGSRSAKAESSASSGARLLRDPRRQLPADRRQAGRRREPLRARARRRLRLRLGAYDRRYPLVIDPGLLYSTYWAEAVGPTRLRHRGRRRRQRLRHRRPRTRPTSRRPRAPSTRPTTAATTPSSPSSTRGSALAYSTYLGGSGCDDAGYGIAVDGAGSAYVTGDTHLDRLPHDRRAPSTRPSTAASRRLRHQAEPDRLRARLLHLPRRDGSDDGGNGIAVDGAGQRLRHRLDRSRPTSPRPPGAFDTTYNGGVRRLRHQAQPDRRRARLLDLPGRQRPTTTGNAHRRGRRRATPTSPATPSRPTSRRRRAPSTRATTAAVRRLRDQAQPGRLRARLLDLPRREQRRRRHGHRRRRRRAAPTSPATRPRPTSRRPRAPSTRAYNGVHDAFVTKLNPAGSALVYSTYLGRQRRRRRRRHRRRRRRAAPTSPATPARRTSRRPRARSTRASTAMTTPS